MGFNKSNRNALGPRFGELMGKECHAAITAAYRKQYETYQRHVETIYQMLDTIETETWGAENEKNETTGAVPVVEVPPTGVASEVESPKEGAGTKKAPAAGAGKSKRTGKGARSPNKGSKRTSSSK